MSRTVAETLSRVLRQIDRPGSFCVSGSAPAVLPGLEVAGMGPVGFPLPATQAAELKKHCEQAPYGKGEETLVDPSVRRVWRMKPERFTVTNPDWQPFLHETVRKVQQELGLEKQKLESHLYDLLLYEKGSFFLPHRDGEKLDRMVATLVIVLPSSFEGGELVVRHDGQEQTIDFHSGENTLYRIHFVAFYADCEHEVRPLRAGHRLCLVYNLTLTKSKKALTAPRNAGFVEPISQALRDWARDDTAHKLAVTLQHQYTQDGLTWDTLKGVDRVQARVLREAAPQAGCQAHLAILTLHESGSAVDDGYEYYRRRRRRWDDDDEEEDSGSHEMEEVFESSLTADHWIDSQGNRLSLGPIHVDEGEILDPDSIREVDPEEQYEGYTGNEGMTLERWYRHAAIFLWPNRRHFAVLCDAGSRSAVEALKLLVNQWRQATSRNAAALHADCVTFAAAIVARWQATPTRVRFGEAAEPSPLLPLLVDLDDPGLIAAYLTEVLARDASVDPGDTLRAVCQQHGWQTFQGELEGVFKNTKAETLERNVRLLEQICLARPRKKKGWIELCRVLAPATLLALEGIDQGPGANDYWPRRTDRAPVLAGLARSMLASGQFELLGRLADHALARPEKYPLTEGHVAALIALQPWLKKHVEKPCPDLSRWIAACCRQLEALTAQVPQAPADFTRSAPTSCKCADCTELRQFMADPREQVHRFRMREDRRRHLEHAISGHACDLDLQTDRSNSPHTLVCTKNTASYQAKLKKFHRDQEHLATLRSIQASLPK